ncbi:cation:proton antiporter [Geodermatophilus chilensis]|uniref:cation:proton antiporter n=1 Tax=Geodermatophilus chilensis TaxID=2035835 RepID=UPI000C25E524|nr:cation:proton antiporter [Geodermatophilus chilensis]
MHLLLAFAIVLFAGVLLSGLAHRTVLSTAVLFLAGFVLGGGVTGVVDLRPDDDIVVGLAELALFSVLYTDGMRVGFSDLRRAWRLPVRALVLGMPLTFGVTAVLAHYVAGLPWLESMLVGAVLAPTDPVFASAIVGREEVPGRLRSLLNVESGLNDGLALPVVLVLLSVLEQDDVSLTSLATELALGVALGVFVPALAVLLIRSRYTSATPLYASLGGLSIGLMVLGIASVTHANLFLAAFTAGITVATLAPDVEHSFAEFDELVTELLKLAAILVFGALISPAFLGEIPLSGYLFAVLALVLARPIAIFLSLLRSRLPLPEQAVAAWFGPKGFASVVYGLLILEAGVTRGDEMFHLVALVIFASILAHSSTDVPIAHAFARAETRRSGPALAAEPAVLQETEEPRKDRQG